MPASKAIRTHISVAIPGSVTADTPHLREKTAKLGLIARACSIFGVDEIIIYRDDLQRDLEEDLDLADLILRFAETPSYLRRRLFPMSRKLMFTGIIPPIQAPHHQVSSTPSGSAVGELREGVVVSKYENKLMVDVGFPDSIGCLGDASKGERITVRVHTNGKKLTGEVVERSSIPRYGGYRVEKTSSSLGRLLRAKSQDLEIGTSRYGSAFRDVSSKLIDAIRRDRSMLLVFGSPRMGLREILKQEGETPNNVFDYYVNMIPNQQVSTVRTEEAIFISLGVLNAVGFM